MGVMLSADDSGLCSAYFRESACRMMVGGGVGLFSTRFAGRGDGMGRRAPLGALRCPPPARCVGVDCTV